MNQVMLILLAILVAANLVVTVVVARSVSYENKQKRLQFLFIWLVPVIGASLAWHLLREHRTERLTTDLSDKHGSADGVISNQDAYTESSSVESGGADGGSSSD